MVNLALFRKLVFIIWQEETPNTDQLLSLMLKKWFKWTSKNKISSNVKFISSNSLLEICWSLAVLKCGSLLSMWGMKVLCQWWVQWKAQFHFYNRHLDLECMLLTLFDHLERALSFGRLPKNFFKKTLKEK